MRNLSKIFVVSQLILIAVIFWLVYNGFYVREIYGGYPTGQVCRLDFFDSNYVGFGAIVDDAVFNDTKTTRCETLKEVCLTYENSSFNCRWNRNACECFPFLNSE